MRLRDALDLCTNAHEECWVKVPGKRPATAMVAGLFDPGGPEPATRPLEGHTIAVYEPFARLSIVWPVPDEEEGERPVRYERSLPEWAEWDNLDPTPRIVLESPIHRVDAEEARPV